jgi:hypothetical protein
MLPDTRLVAILRNPVDRAYSHWWMRFCTGVERLPFEAAIEENHRRIEKGDLLEGDSGAKFWKSHMMTKRPHVSLRVYLDGGYHAHQVKRYFALFPLKSIRILFFDDLISSQDSFFRDVCEFLEIDPDKAPGKMVPANVAYSKGMLPFIRLDQKIPVSKVLPEKAKNVIRAGMGLFSKIPEINRETKAWLSHHY